MTRPRRIRIELGDTVFHAALNETSTAQQLWEALPVAGNGNFWGKEIYFDIGKRLPDTNPKEKVDVGDVAYWAPGTCLCLFWGATPASDDERPRAASPVTVVGRLTEDPDDLESVEAIDRIVVSRDDASEEDVHGDVPGD